VFSILRVPADLQGNDYDRLMEQGAWIPLLPGVEKGEMVVLASGRVGGGMAGGLGAPRFREAFVRIHRPAGERYRFAILDSALGPTASRAFRVTNTHSVAHAQCALTKNIVRSRCRSFFGASPFLEGW